MTPIQKAELLAFVAALEPVAAPAPVPVPPPPPAWVDVAAEGAGFNLDTPARVRYGAGSSWAELDLPPGSNYCGNATFGGDPAPNVAKTCQVQTGTPAPAPVPPPPAPTPPPPPPSAPGATLYFSSAGNNANAGTQASPKRDLNGINFSTLPAGTTLRFNRGDTWSFSTYKILENLNVSATSPLTFEDYGTGALPCFQQTSGNMFHMGGNWNNSTNDGGYVFRNLKLDGMGTAEWCFWFVHRVRDVVVDNCEVTRFRIGFNSNDTDDHGVHGIVIRNCHIHHNSSMGMLGHYSDLLLENNHIQANNFGGSAFDHGTYIGGGNNITIRGNHYDRNSVVNGVGTGGNMTFHGQIDGLLIEGNTITQDASTAWLMSITQGYSTAEWFLNTVVRNNILINGGNTAMSIQSAPGILVEGNTIINRQGTNQTAIFVGSGDYPNGDIADGNAIVRNNTIRRANGSSGTPVQFINAPGSISQNNIVVLE